MTPFRAPLILLCSAAVLLPAVGCLKRKETITVKPDASVDITLQYEGDANEFEYGDAMPTASVTDSFTSKTEVEDNGDVSRTVNAQQHFEASADLPANFALVADPNADLYVQFPTRVWTERTREGTYYNFARTYVARPWASVDYWQQLVMEGEIKKIAEKPVEELTTKERIKLIEHFATIEALKQAEFAKEALRECAPDLTQRLRLLARQNLLNVFSADEMLPNRASLNIADDDKYVEALVSRCDALAAEQRDACFSAEADRVLSISLDAFVRSLREDTGFTDRDVDAFLASYDRAKQRYDITDRLAGHAWEVCVNLPGTLAAHNGDNVNPKMKDGGCQVCWSFDGKAIRDRDVDLMATSFVPATDQNR